MKNTIIRSCLFISLFSQSLNGMEAQMYKASDSLLSEENGEVRMNLISLFLHDHEQYKRNREGLPSSVLVSLKRYILQKNLLVKRLKYELVKSCVLKLVVHTATAKVATFGKTGSTLVTCSDDGSAKLWDVKSCVCLATFVHLNCKNALLNAAEDKLVTYCDRFVQIWDIKSGTVIGVLQGHKDKINEVRFSHQTDNVVTASEDGTAKVWKSNGESLLTITVEEPLISAQFDLKDKRVITVSKNKKVNVWDGQTGKFWFAPLEKKYFFFATVFAPIEMVAVGDDLLATSHEDGTV